MQPRLRAASAEAGCVARRLSLAAALLAPSIAWSGRPLFTDDATVTPAGACQAESWYQRNADGGYEWNTMPACNLAGDVEVTLGLTRHSADDAAIANTYSLQGKKIFREIAANGWGWGIASGITHETQDDKGPTLSSYYFYIPLSLSFGHDRYQVHLNTGAYHQRLDDSTAWTWGLGSTAQLSLRLMAFAEIYGSGETASVHAGASLSLLRERVHLDFTAGRNLSGSTPGNFVSVGLNFYLPPLL